MPEPVYLLSLPRSGSTLLQRMLAAHPDINTTSEPNVVLYPLLSLQPRSVFALEDHEYFLTAIGEFVERLPGKQDDLFLELGLFARRLYAKAMTRPARYFLDKSPGYCFVAPSILKLHDDGKYIFLWRHPLATVASMVRFPGANPRQWSLYRFPHFYEGLANLVEAYLGHREKAIGIRYVDLVTSPRTVLAQLLDYLELPDDHDLATEFRSVQLSGSSYDPNARLAEYDVVRTDRVAAWQRTFCNPLRKRWARRYLHWIGKERLAVMGYDLDGVLAELDALPNSLHLVGPDAYWMTYGLFYRLMNGRILRDNLRRWRAGDLFWAYR